MTLDNTELLVRIFSEFRVISHIWEATTATRMKIDHTNISRTAITTAAVSIESYIIDFLQIS